MFPLTVDVHTHVVPSEFPPYRGTRSDHGWPSTVAPSCCHRHILISGKNFRTVSSQCWDVQARLDDMDGMGIGEQVMSPMPELLSYWMDPADGARMCANMNDFVAALVAERPERFFGLGIVPLQDLDLAIRELERIMVERKLAGIEIATNVNGRVIGDPFFLPFFEAAEALGAAVFVHPLRPSGMERLVGAAALEQVLAFPGETGLAAASLMSSGVFSRVPGLRIAFSHGGGSLSTLITRFQHAWEAIPQVRDDIPVAPLAQARRMYFDNLVYEGGAILRLMELFGSTQVMVGSDYPFPIREFDPVGRLRALNLGADAERLIARENALRWLNRL